MLSRERSTVEHAFKGEKFWNPSPHGHLGDLPHLVDQVVQPAAMSGHLGLSERE